MNRSQFWLGSVCCLTAAVAWGAVFPTAETIMHHIDPFWMTTYRYGAVSLIMCCILYYKEGARAFKLERKAIKLFSLGAFGYTINSFGLFWGQKQLGVSGTLLASIVEALMPFLVVFFTWITVKKKPRNTTLACMILAFIGICLVITKGDFDGFVAGDLKWLPLISIFIGVTGWVLYTIGSEDFAEWSALRYSTITCVFGSLISLVLCSLLTSVDLIPVNRISDVIPIISNLVFLVVFGGVAALLAWFKGISILTPTNGILFINFVPITALVISIFQGYQVSGPEIVGITLTVIALITNNLFERKLKGSQVKN